MAWDAENILKGKMAESLVGELLKKAGNKVYQFGYESLLQNLTQSDKVIDKDCSAGKKISSFPDLIIVNQARKPIFVEVKFRKDPESLEEELLLEKEHLEKFWEAKIALVTTKKPYFRVLNPPYFKKEKREGWPIPVFSWQPLENDLDLMIPPLLIKNFSQLVEKYYSN